jgi:hypothetical protein
MTAVQLKMHNNCSFRSTKLWNRWPTQRSVFSYITAYSQVKLIFYKPSKKQAWSRQQTDLEKHLFISTLKPIWTYWIQLWGMASTSNIEILECFQSKALYMIVNAPWYVPNTVIGRDLQIPTVKEEIRCYRSIYCSPQHTSKWPNSKPHWATRQQAIAKTPAKWSAYQILSVIVVFVILDFKV